MIEIRCPSCNKKLLDLRPVDNPNVVIEIKCPKCKQVIEIQNSDYSAKVKEPIKNLHKPNEFK